jgi:hypothetical protein
MAPRSQIERITEDGLRFVKKVPAAKLSGLFKSTKSCFVCSKAHTQSDGLRVALLGRMEFFCSQECKEKIFKPKTFSLVQTISQSQ